MPKPVRIKDTLVNADALAFADPPFAFAVGDKVDRRPSSRYRFPGTVIGHGRRLDGRLMYLVELDGYGLVHNFYATDLVPREESTSRPIGS